MTLKYVRVGATSRPTRDEAMETIFDSYIQIKKILKKLENIYLREYNYKHKKNIKNKEQFIQ